MTETSSGAGGRPDAWQVEPGPIDLGKVAVEPDLSNAGPFLAAALVTGGTVTIADWPRDSLQAAGQILEVLTRMGARCEAGPAGMTVTVSGQVHGITADLRDVPELGQVLTAAATVRRIVNMTALCVVEANRGGPPAAPAVSKPKF